MFKFAIALTALVNATPALARSTTYTLQVEVVQRSQRDVIVMRRHMTLNACGLRANQIVHAYANGEVVCVPEK